ncbi:MAG: GNAT family N-acetyltransferase [Nitrososphaerales archaeon]
MNIRPAVVADASKIARVHVDSWKTAYHGIISGDYLASLSYSDREARWSMALSNSNNLVFVAEDNDLDRSNHSIIGFCSGGANRSAKTDPGFAGELGAIYILEEYRSKGVGKALVQSLVRALLNHSHRSMLVWVLAENPYRPFYEKLGGQYIRSKEIEIGGGMFEEVAYGWSDIEILLRY